MYKFQNIENLGLYLYERRLPEHYIMKDSEPEQNYALKRYLSAAGEGLNSIIKDLASFLDLLDPAKCPAEVLPILFKNFGLPYFYDIPAKFHRKILLNIGDLYMRKGTKGVIKYLGRECTGLETRIIEKRGHVLRTWESSNPHYESSDYIPSKTWGEGTYEKYTKTFGGLTNNYTIEIGLALINSWENEDGSVYEQFNKEAFERFVWYFTPFDISVYIIWVMRATEKHTFYIKEPWNTEKGKYYAQYDRFYPDCMLNCEYCLISNNFADRERLCFDLNYLSAVENAGTSDSGFTEINWFSGNDINVLKNRHEISLTNQLRFKTNNTLITNLYNWKQNDRFMPESEHFSGRIGDNSFKQSEKALYEIETYYCPISELSVSKDYEEHVKESRTFSTRMDESKTNNINYRTNTTLITNFQTHIDIISTAEK